MHKFIKFVILLKYHPFLLVRFKQYNKTWPNTAIIIKNLVAFKAAAKLKLSFRKLRPVDQKLMISSSFRCDQTKHCHKICVWSQFVVLHKSDFDVQQTLLWGWLVEQKLMLSSSFRCDQIYNYQRYEFGHTLLCYLSLP